jgi:hypothetical protein
MEYRENQQNDLEIIQAEHGILARSPLDKTWVANIC